MIGAKRAGKKAPPPCCTSNCFLPLYLSPFRSAVSNLSNRACLLRRFFSAGLSGTLPLKIFNAHSHIHLTRSRSAVLSKTTLCLLSRWFNALKIFACFLDMGHFLLLLQSLRLFDAIIRKWLRTWAEFFSFSLPRMYKHLSVRKPSGRHFRAEKYLLWNV